MTYVSSPSSPDQSQPSNPHFPPGGAGEFLPSTLNGRGLKSGQGQGLVGGGVGGFLLCPCLSPSSYLPPTPTPLETEDLLFSIIYNLRIGPPVLSSPLT